MFQSIVMIAEGTFWGGVVGAVGRVSNKGWRMANFASSLLTFEEYSP